MKDVLNILNGTIICVLGLETCWAHPVLVPASITNLVIQKVYNTYLRNKMCIKFIYNSKSVA